MVNGEVEKNSFEYIKRSIFIENINQISLDDFNKNRIDYFACSPDKLFAISEEDIECIENAFFTAYPNPNPSEFPDYITDSGFIEHFSISSSEITKAGSDYKQALSNHNKEFWEEVKKGESQMDCGINSYDPIIVKKQFTYNSSGHSHANLLYSLKKSLDKHINSLKKYNGSSQTKIFIIEYTEGFIHMSVDYSNIKAEKYYGDLLKRENTKEYRISHDKDALNILYERRDFIDYAIYDAGDYFEIINIHNIPEILKLLRYDYDFYPIHYSTISFGTMTKTELKQ